MCRVKRSRFFVVAVVALCLGTHWSVTPADAAACPGNPDALGVSRTVEIDTQGGPAFGLAQYKAHDFLGQGEVILTFDDGPWPKTTAAVLDALAKHCAKATFFVIGKHAIWHPDILKKVAAAGHTIGSHTWSHANLARGKFKKGDAGEAEIEKGLSAVKVALGANPSPFFRFPFLQDPKEMLSYLGSRNMAIFSMNVDSFDFKIRNQKKLIRSVMKKLKNKGKGILLMHDFQKVTANALPELLRELKAGGFKIVHMVPKARAVTLADFDKKVAEELDPTMKGARPTKSVVRTITGDEVTTTDQ